MIRNISGSRYIQVSGGTTSNPYISPGASGAGMVRWNSNMSGLEINDGNSWQHLHVAHPTVSLTAEAESLLDWARTKRDEDLALKELLKKHSGLEELYEKFQMLKALVTEEGKNGN